MFTTFENYSVDLSRRGSVVNVDYGQLQTRLTYLNRERLSPALPSEDWSSMLTRNNELAFDEGLFLESERLAVQERAATAPTDANEFAAWFDALKQTGPGQYDVLFDYLADHASLNELRWFMQQEVAGEAGFDDLVALTQLRMPRRAKLELARNYWDEMGRGKPKAMHGPMLEELAECLGISGSPTEAVVWESLALGNVLVGLAYNRRFAFHAVGALGVVELTAPTRAVKVVEAMDRLGVDRSASHYFRVHATVDLAHYQAWRDEVLIPLVQAQPGVAVAVAEGALMRLRAGQRTFERYRREFGLSAARPQ